jgi:phosphoglycolate phosphatase
VNNLWKTKRHVVFDWNGTLIDDLSLAVEAVNECCRHFAVSPISREQYRENFRFPIREFYAAIGFDLETVAFAQIVRRYLTVFDRRVVDCPLHDGVEALLEEMRTSGKTLSILSASHEAILRDTLDKKGLLQYFTHVIGLKDEHAAGKVEQGLSLQASLNLSPDETIYIGDTTHDADVARAVGWVSQLVACGHQCERRLNDSLCTVFAHPRLLATASSSS